MSELLGKKLRQARLKKGYSIEDVAHQTRLPEATVRRLEEDDYSGFTNGAYARGFLSIYSGFLEVDAWEKMQALAPRGKKPATGETPALNLDPADTVIPITKTGLVMERRSSGSSANTLILVVLLLVGIPSVYLVGKRVGSYESNLALQSPDRSVPMLAPGDAAPVGIPAKPVTPPADQPPVLKPDPEFNALIGIGTPVTAKARPLGEFFGKPAPSPSLVPTSAPLPSPGPEPRQMSSNSPSQEPPQQ